jgi:hypothetical protein
LLRQFFRGIAWGEKKARRMIGNGNEESSKWII